MRPSDTVHQLVFGNVYGMVVIAGSLGEGPERDQWQSRLRHHVRMEEFQGHQPPSTALSYLVLDDGTAAVIRRFDDGRATRARGRMHALVGSAAALTPDVAIGLDTWGRWNLPVAPGAVLPPIQVGELEQQRDFAAQEYLEEGARQRKELLPPVLAALAAEPGGLVVFGCAPDDAVPMMWGLHRIAGQAFPERAAWTFSTYEAQRLDGPQTARIVFLRERPKAHTQRMLVDVSSDSMLAVSRGIGDWADRSVADFVHSGRSAVAPPAPAEGETLQQPLVSASDVAGHDRSGAQSGVVVAAATPGMITEQAGHRSDPARVPTSEGGPPRGGLDDLPYADAGVGNGGRRLTDTPPDRQHPPLVADLLATTDPAAFWAVFERWRLSPGASTRAALRPESLCTAYEHLAVRTDPAKLDNNTVWLLDAVLGRDCVEIDTEDGFAYVREMLQVSAKDSRRARPLVKRMVMTTRKKKNGMDELSVAIVDAYLDSLGLTSRPESRTGPVVPQSEPAKPWDPRSPDKKPKGWAGLSPVQRLIAVGALAAVLVVALVVFVLSRLPATDVTPQPTSPTTEELEPVPTTTDPPTTTPTQDDGAGDPPIPAQLIVAAIDVDQEIVFVLYRLDDEAGAIVGPTCSREGEDFICRPVPAEAPEGFRIVQVAQSSQEVYSSYAEGQVVPIADNGVLADGGMRAVRYLTG